MKHSEAFTIGTADGQLPDPFDAFAVEDSEARLTLQKSFRLKRTFEWWTCFRNRCATLVIEDGSIEVVIMPADAGEQFNALAVWGRSSIRRVARHACA